MITSWNLYWITRLDPIGTTLIWIGIIFLTFAALAQACKMMQEVACLSSDDEAIRSIRKCTNFSIFSCFFSCSLFFACAFIPSTKEMAAILVIPKIANSTFVSETLPKEANELYGMAKDYLKSKLVQPEDKKK